jgi:hypothetical protein
VEKLAHWNSSKSLVSFFIIRVAFALRIPRRFPLRQTRFPSLFYATRPSALATSVIAKKKRESEDSRWD